MFHPSDDHPDHPRGSRGYYDPHRPRVPRDHYDPNQPRVPRGHTDGGQWTSGGYRPLSELAELYNMSKDDSMKGVTTFILTRVRPSTPPKRTR